MTTRKTTSGTVRVLVGRFGSDPVQVQVSRGGTVRKVLEKADLEISDSERIWLNGSRTTLSSKVKAGDIISIVSPKEAGL